MAVRGVIFGRTSWEMCLYGANICFRQCNIPKPERVDYEMKFHSHALGNAGTLDWEPKALEAIVISVN